MPAVMRVCTKPGPHHHHPGAGADQGVAQALGEGVEAGLGRAVDEVASCGPARRRPTRARPGCRGPGRGGGRRRPGRRDGADVVDAGGVGGGLGIGVEVGLVAEHAEGQEHQVDVAVRSNTSPMTLACDGGVEGVEGDHLDRRRPAARSSAAAPRPTSGSRTASTTRRQRASTAGGRWPARSRRSRPTPAPTGAIRGRPACGAPEARAGVDGSGDLSARPGRAPARSGCPIVAPVPVGTQPRDRSTRPSPTGPRPALVSGPGGPGGRPRPRACWRRCSTPCWGPATCSTTGSPCATPTSTGPGPRPGPISTRPARAPPWSTPWCSGSAQHPLAVLAMQARDRRGHRRAARGRAPSATSRRAWRSARAPLGRAARTTPRSRSGPRPPTSPCACCWPVAATCSARVDRDRAGPGRRPRAVRRCRRSATRRSSRWPRR